MAFSQFWTIAGSTRLGSPSWAHGGGGGGEPGTSPGDANGGSGPLIWHDASDDDVNWQDTGETTAAGDGDIAARVNNKGSGTESGTRVSINGGAPTRTLESGIWHWSFDGVNDNLRHNGGADGLCVDPFDVFIAFREPTSLGKWIFGTYNDTNASGALFSSTGPNRLIWITQGGGPAFDVPFASGSHSADTWHVVAIRANGASGEIYYDGVAQLGGDDLDTNNGKNFTNLAGNPFNSTVSAVDIAQFIAFNTTLSTADFEGVQTWLGAKVGLTI